MKRKIKKFDEMWDRLTSADIREKIYVDLMKIADDNELEDMRREIIRYFSN